MRGLYFAAFLLFAISVSAQQATTNTSGSGQAGNIILDWSLGELTLVHTVQNGNLVFTQGLHQGVLIDLNASGSVIAHGELLVYPNPARRTLNLGIGFFETGTLSLRLFSPTGALLRQSEYPITAFGNRHIDLTPYANGVYMLHAVFTPTNGQPRKNTYKILHLQ
ncbi:MAG TPA: hypothetical protein VD996_12655 [Chitinophagaceae bacterium]|nr:hypothetical protein [Chitinophagaceae bacterium]